jgi:hypothetical protein
VLWVIRNVLSGLVLLAPALLSSARDDLAGLVREVAADLVTLGIPVAGVVSDGSTLFVTYPPQFALNRSKPLYSVGRNVVRNLCCCQITETNEQVIWNSWRRERDSNPRYHFWYTHFPGVRLQPLGHPSIKAAENRGERRRIQVLRSLSLPRK